VRAVFVSLVLLNILHFVYREQLYKPPIKSTVTVVEQDIESIFLLSENSTFNLKEKEMDLVVNNPLKVEAGGVEECLAIGPFDDIFKGQNIVYQLSAIELSAKLKAIDRPTGENDYRVMMPAASSLQEAFRKLRELDSQNIDSYVITEGQDALGISLGVFSTQVAAESLKQVLSKSGYVVEIVLIPTLVREFWIFSSDGQNLSVDGDTWTSLVANYPEIEQRLQQCP